MQLGFHFKGSAVAAPAEEHAGAPDHLLVRVLKGLLNSNGTPPVLHQLSHLQVHSGLTAVTDING